MYNSTFHQYYFVVQNKPLLGFLSLVFLLQKKRKLATYQMVHIQSQRYFCLPQKPSFTARNCSSLLKTEENVDKYKIYFHCAKMSNFLSTMLVCINTTSIYLHVSIVCLLFVQRKIIQDFITKHMSYSFPQLSFKRFNHTYIMFCLFVLLLRLKRFEINI